MLRAANFITDAAELMLSPRYEFRGDDSPCAFVFVSIVDLKAFINCSASVIVSKYMFSKSALYVEWSVSFEISNVSNFDCTASKLSHASSAFL